MEEEGKGISLGEIFRTIFVKKWLALIILVVITVVGTIGIHFVYSKPAKVYQMNFTVSNATAAAALYNYADGTTFYISDFVSEETLTAVKNSKAEYKDLDLDKIINSDDTKWSQEIVTIVSDLKDVNAEDTTRYLERKGTFTIAAKYFADEDQARSFMYDLLYYPAEKFKTIDLNYNVYLDEYNFKNALTYGTQLDYISSQIEYLYSLYNALPDIAQEDGTLVSKYRQDFNAWAARQDISALRTEGTANYYLKDWRTTIAKYENSLVSLRHSLEDAQTKLTAAEGNYQKLLESGAIIADGSIVTIIDGYKSEVTSLKRQISTYYNYIASYYEVSNFVVGMDSESFDFTVPLQFVLDGNGNRKEIQSHITATKTYEAKIQAVYDEMINGSEQTGNRSYTELFKDYSRQVYPKSAKKLITSANVATDGGLSIFITFAISLVLGLVVACIAAYIAGRQQLKKQTVPHDYTGCDIPMVSSEIQAAAAVAEEETDEEKGDNKTKKE